MVKEVASGPLKSYGRCRCAGLCPSWRSQRHWGSTAPQGRQRAREPAAPPRERVRGGRSRRQASAIYPGAAGGRRGVLGGGSRRSGACGERTDGRTHARTRGAARRRRRVSRWRRRALGAAAAQGEDGGVFGQALPSRVRQEWPRLLQEMQREHPQGLAADGHHGAGAGGRAALCAAGLPCPGGVGGGLAERSGPGRAGPSQSARGLWALLLPVRPTGWTFQKVLPILQEKPGKYGLKLVVSFSL